MRKRVVVPATAGILVVVSISSWLLAAQSHGSLPHGDFSPRPSSTWTLTGADAEVIRRDAIRRAAVMTPGVTSDFQGTRTSHPVSSLVTCRFLRAIPTGTSAKFDCVVDGGEVVKIKYGRNPEIQAEVAATRLLSRLGFAADDVEIVPRLRCYGCPRFPFLTMQLLSAAFGENLIGEHGYDDGYTDFEWVALEHKFPAPAIETVAKKGWAWWELEASSAPPGELDALRLMAVFLSHWDNKAENQRLVCIDDLREPGQTSRSAAPSKAATAGLERPALRTTNFSRECTQPLLMIQDLGATFGPSKVNLARWTEFPIWSDRDACRVSLRRMPFEGGTFQDVAISEEGRIGLGRRLASLTAAEVQTLFEAARFPDYHAGTDDRRDVAAWHGAFRSRVDQILTAGPCPA